MIDNAAIERVLWLLIVLGSLVGLAVYVATRFSPEESDEGLVIGDVLIEAAAMDAQTQTMARIDSWIDRRSEELARERPPDEHGFYIVTAEDVWRAAGELVREM